MMRTSIWQGSFMLGNIEMRVHVLDDGQRIIEEECVAELFSATSIFTQEQVAEFALWLAGPHNASSD